MKFIKLILSVFLTILIVGKCNAQISPGELYNGHNNLEGVSNCTKCHIIGDKVSNDKCLSCHTELKERTSQNKGYHSSGEVKGKECATCHNDHHGQNFQIVKFEPDKFNHTLTDYSLTGAHAKKKCIDCHTSKNINDPKIKTKKFTYLGLSIACVSCHADYHNKTLSVNCNDCHDAVAFKPAPKFKHTSAKYQLSGKHLNVECIKCHKIETKNEKKIQVFTGLQYKNCTDCHQDPHNNKFGQNCAQCHSEVSFQETKNINNFDHSKTNYKLEEKHLMVDCKLCHTGKYTTTLKHEKCTDCHTDYHKKQFAKAGVSPDCSVCHNLSGFVNTSYSIEQHNKSVFPLQGSHTALPCIDCHKKTEKWMFNEIGKRCADCHKDIHKDFINKKYYPEGNCQICHDLTSWGKITFDHSNTNFKLIGGHALQSCSKCHFTENINGTRQQKFSNLPVICNTCHTDKHFKQFDKEGTTDCATCHESENWKAVKFNHNTTQFKLDGKHANVDCKKCHKPTEINQNKYILYKINVKCESCH